MNKPQTRTALRCDTCPSRDSVTFCGFAPAPGRALSGLGVHIGISAGSILHRQGEPAEAVSILCEGQVKLSCTSESGKRLILRIARNGELLGLSAVLTGARYETTAEALLPTRVKIIPRTAFLAFMNQYPEAGCHTAQTLAADCQSTFLDAKRLALCSSAKERLGKVLVDWARTGSAEGGRLRFQLLLSHAELGDLAGLSRETVTRTLADFRQKGWISMKGATVEVLCPAELEAGID